jgi:cytochrome c-type biogenesis protein CcmH/NrfF
MGNSGVGMLLGDSSVMALWMMFIGAFILGGTILYGVMKTGRLRRNERAQLDRNTEMAQRRDDPEKRAAR